MVELNALRLVTGANVNELILLSENRTYDHRVKVRRCAATGVYTEAGLLPLMSNYDYILNRQQYSIGLIYNYI